MLQNTYPSDVNEMIDNNMGERAKKKINQPINQPNQFKQIKMIKIHAIARRVMKEELGDRRGDGGHL